MSQWARQRRSWLVLAYVLATLAVQTGHRHATESDEATRCLASCRDNRVHVSGHPAPDLDHPHNGCVACHFRAAHLALIVPAVEPLPADAGASDDPPSAVAIRLAVPRASCRAPPIA